MNNKRYFFAKILMISKIFFLIIFTLSFLNMYSFFLLKRSILNFQKNKKNFVRHFHKNHPTNENEKNIAKKQATIPFKQNKKIYPLFSRSTDLANAFCSLINNEQKRISISVYILTDHKLITALCNAKKRGVAVDIVIDPQSLRLNDLKELKKHNVSFSVHKGTTPETKMHHKMALFFENNILGKLYKVIWHGSYNFTHSGAKKNAESVIVTRNDKKLFTEFLKEFEAIKNEVQK